MSKKRLSITVVTLVFVVGAGFAVLLAMSDDRPGVTKANFDRIREGMTMQEVEQILGGPGLPFHGFANKAPSSTFVWSGVDGSLAIVDVMDNTILVKMWHPSNESILTKLRRWLHLPK